ncbi:C40 family peptidase [Nonomuraea sp. NPDC003707]
MSGIVKLVTGVVAVVTALVLGLVVMAALVGGAASSAPAPQVHELKQQAVPAKYRSWVAQAGRLCPQVSAALIAAQLQAESGWRERVVSSAGAQGLAQFMPGTWRSFGRDEDGNGRASPFDPGDAIMAMGRYDCFLATKVGHLAGDVLANILAAYNAGPGAVLSHRGVPPFAETQAYIQRIRALLPRFGQVRDAQLPPAAGGLGGRIVAAATTMLGTPYSWGGGGSGGPSAGTGRGAATVGFDCSGLVQYAVYQASGGRVRLPRTSQQQARVGSPVERGDLQPGDLIAFDRRNGEGFGHIGIYIGNGRMVHAPQTGDVVRIGSLAGRTGQIWAIRRIR